MFPYFIILSLAASPYSYDTRMMHRFRSIYTKTSEKVTQNSKCTSEACLTGG